MSESEKVEIKTCIMIKRMLGMMQLKFVYSDVQGVTFDLKQPTDERCTLNRSGDVFETSAERA